MQSKDQDVCVPVPGARYRKYMQAKYYLAKRCAGEILPIRDPAREVVEQHDQEAGRQIACGVEKPEHNSSCCIKESSFDNDVANCIAARDFKGMRKDFNIILTPGRGAYKPKMSEEVGTVSCNAFEQNCFVTDGVKEEELSPIELTAGVAQAERIYSDDGVSVTLAANGGGGGGKTGLYLVKNDVIPDEQSLSRTIRTGDISSFDKKHFWLLIKQYYRASQMITRIFLLILRAGQSGRAIRQNINRQATR